MRVLVPASKGPHFLCRLAKPSFQRLAGTGDTRWPLAFSLIGLLGVRIPVAYWLAHETILIPGTNWTLVGCGLGVLGAWYAMAIDLHVRAALFIYRITHGGWKRVKV